MGKAFLALVCFYMAFVMFRAAVEIWRGEFEKHPILHNLDMARRKSIAKYYSLVAMVVAIDALVFAVRIAFADSAGSSWRSQFSLFLQVAAACLFAWLAVGPFWFRKR
jgi:hypothetical protein